MLVMSTAFRESFKPFALSSSIASYKRLECLPLLIPLSKWLFMFLQDVQAEDDRLRHQDYPRFSFFSIVYLGITTSMSLLIWQMIASCFTSSSPKV